VDGEILVSDERIAGFQRGWDCNHPTVLRVSHSHQCGLKPRNNSIRAREPSNSGTWTQASLSYLKPDSTGGVELVAWTAAVRHVSKHWPYPIPMMVEAAVR